MQESNEENVMKSLLWISPYVPYDTVSHASGKTHNHYIKFFSKKKYFDITLLTLAFKSQMPKIDLHEYGIKYEVGMIKEDIFHTLCRYIANVESEYSPFNRYCGVFSNYQRSILVKLIKNYANKNKMSDPEIIILHWTQTLFLLPLIKELYPKSKIVAIEEDVVFLSYERKLKYSKNWLSKSIWQYKYKKVKEMEKKYLNISDLIVVNNKKDQKLLQQENINHKKIKLCAVHYDDYESVERNAEGKNILFFGAMKRKENYLSVKWFIDYVMPHLEGEGINLIVVGGGGKETLKNIKNKNVQIMGFVEDVKPFFEKCFCLVAPLVLGAGIKVKVLEAFSAGIPVLTNNIGIEGIYAEDGKDYFHCESVEDYVKTILELKDNLHLQKQVSHNAREFIKNNFKTDDLLEILVDEINMLGSNPRKQF